eukprot:CAMPEP_0196737946 /NCGR_PEP_ID=MMETSP1091-20130531/15505_1 /TAXON_ID=302021 /ORGANISM="Rhodomonas sp., Strain CCMP768" /LENGTH=672 /DNA_ID=CAMNT_0042081869 /DNA_START=35 /DNA_END=2053 /DNA_ORIENTATION=+
MKLIFFLATVVACSGYLVYALTEVQPTAALAHFTELSAKFRKFHQDPTNVFLHLLTTPLGILSVLSLVNKVSKGSGIVMLTTVVYCISLVDKVPENILAQTSLMAGALAVASTLVQHLGWMMHLAIFLVGYVGQEAAHYFTGEATFQSSYQQQSDFLSLLSEHTYYLLPLVFDSTYPEGSGQLASAEAEWVSLLASRVYHLLPLVVVLAMHFVSKDGALTFPWQFQRSRVIMVKLTEPQDVADLAAIRSWAMSKGPSKATSTHWWYQAPAPTTPKENCLEPEPKAAFHRIATCDTINNAFRNRFGANWCIDVIWGMNEVYVSSPPTVKNTSDEVFYTRHIDGPYYFVPFASCFRMIIGLDENEAITTKFPMVPCENAAKTGDVLAFDFHREVHYIQKNPDIENKDFRIVLKVHHCFYPAWAAPFGKLLHYLSFRYNKAFRSLFLYTINPDGAWNKFVAWNVVFWTKVVNWSEENIGYSNIGYLVCLGLAAAVVDWRIFLVGTSFVHYIRYINTYYHREGVAYNVFKRDVFLFKILAVSQLVLHYFYAATSGFTQPVSVLGEQVGPVDLAMVLGGYGLSIYTTYQLGVDGTYFGIELGFVKAQKNYVQKFPYGVIPHPMILSQCVALCGLYKNALFRAHLPWLVPIHVCLYLIHMVQEHFDIYKSKGLKTKAV